MNNILIPTLVLAILGFVLAGLLGVISKKFEVETDPIVERVREALPGANCGACGYPGCDGCANAIAKGEAPVSACVIGGQSVTDSVASAMGVESAGAGEKQVAVVKCNGTCDNAKDLYEYAGLDDCRAQIALFGGKSLQLWMCRMWILR